MLDQRDGTDADIPRSGLGRQGALADTEGFLSAHWPGLSWGMW